MRAYIVPALAMLALALAAQACSGGFFPYRETGALAPCERPRADLKGLNGVYHPVSPSNCQVAILPTDLSAWIEAPLNSHRLRGLKRVILGCANLTAEAADCEYGGLLGHAVTAMFNYDLSKYPERARVQRAVLALRVEDNLQAFSQLASLRGRLMTGDILQSLGSEAILPAAAPGWVQFDITAFVARAVNERRPSVQFEISLPCGRSGSELTTITLLDAEPRLVVEFR
jgi:hypothetical protein